MRLLGYRLVLLFPAVHVEEEEHVLAICQCVCVQVTSLFRLSTVTQHRHYIS